MRKEHYFKAGFEIGEQKRNFFAYQLMVFTEEFDSQQAYRLADAVDKEYRKLLAEQCGIEKGGISEWLGKISD